MLQLEKISAEENVFDLGVHSLLAVQLHRRLCEALGQDFPLISMFQYPTIQTLAQHLEVAKKTAMAARGFAIGLNFSEMQWPDCSRPAHEGN